VCRSAAGTIAASTEVVHDNFCALTSKFQRVLAAYAATRPRDDRDPAREIHHRGLSSSSIHGHIRSNTVARLVAADFVLLFVGLCVFACLSQENRRDRAAFVVGFARACPVLRSS